MTSQLTMSETLESLLTDRKILLFRYDANLRKEIFKKLTALQKQLLTRVSAAGIESISKSELQSLLKDVKTLIADTYTDVNAYSSKELNALLPIETDATAKIYNESVQFDLFNIVPERTLNAAKNADLIAGTPLKDWWAKQGDDLAFKFSALIRQGMIDGKQTSRLITETKDLLAHSRRGAETLVRTAVMKVHDKAQELFKDENLDLLKGEKHLSTLDTRTSEICRVRDGLAWDLDKKPIGEHAVPYARPPLHPNCRSTLILITKSWKELGLDMDEIPESTRASMDGQVKAGLTYENWLKNKTPEQQDAILGKGKADLWRQGVITFRDMLDQSGRPLTLKQLNVAFSGENWQEHFRKLSNESVVYSEKAQELFSIMEDSGVEYNPVQTLKKPLTQQEIIDKISGGDMTEGSCASLAFAYIGNKFGIDVTDFRGGISREKFSWEYGKVLSLPGIASNRYIVGRAESREVSEILKSTLVVNKEYYLAAGKHAAIIRKTESDFEYLELQSSEKNGWKSLTKNGRGKIANVLHERFKTAKLDKYRHSVYLAEVDSFKDNKDFEKVLGYLNTATDKQLKGALGSEK
ncbi:minor capsid protein [Actinobacillus porcinus]|uniref:minor capsid protein n=1 Tax=Actinobacillus porcinus TaxID=51048 RepID=UPI0023536AD2|nr:minor capsid protein [Actinobacillus porcinus]